MYLEHFQLNHPPFMEEPDAHIFYGGGGRETIYQALMRDVVGGKALIKLTGREGSGKTLLCRLVLENLPEQYDAVCIDNPIGSFDDVLRIVCLDLGMQPIVGEGPVDFADELTRMIQQHQEQGRRVLVIIDEAEKLFLATLERLVRTICSSTGSNSLRILLAGRPGLDANLEQLSVFCGNVDINVGYTLMPLTENETREYMMMRLEKAGLSREKYAELFSEGAISKIHASAQGNIRMINILAEESLQNSFSDKSFMVLLDHVAVEERGRNGAEKRVERIGERFFSLGAVLAENKMLAGAAGAVVVLVVIIGLLLRAGTEQNLTKSSPPTIVIGTSESGIEKFVKEESVSEESVSPNLAASDISVTQAAPAKPVPKSPPKSMQELPEAEREVTLVQEEPVVVERDKLQAEQAGKPVVGEIAVVPPAEDGEQEVAIASLEFPGPEQQHITGERSGEQPGIITIMPVGKKRPYGAPKEVAAEVLEEQVFPVVQVRAEKEKKNVSPPVRAEKETGQAMLIRGRDGEKLFRERRKASSTWLAEAYRGAYTVQLMMLASNQAESNLMKMLTSDEYFEIKNKLYILRKKTTPPTLFVYYGIYDSMEQARRARNSMPVFLRKHHPYALSINDALDKAEENL